MQIAETDAYLKKKEKLLKTKIDLQDKLKDLDKKGVAWSELAKNCLKAAHHAEKLASSTDLLEIKSFFKNTARTDIYCTKKWGWILLNLLQLSVSIRRWQVR